MPTKRPRLLEKVRDLSRTTYLIKENDDRTEWTPKLGLGSLICTFLVVLGLAICTGFGVMVNHMMRSGAPWWFALFPGLMFIPLGLAFLVFGGRGLFLQNRTLVLESSGRLRYGREILLQPMTAKTVYIAIEDIETDTGYKLGEIATLYVELNDDSKVELPWPHFRPFSDREIASSIGQKIAIAHKVTLQHGPPMPVKGAGCGKAILGVAVAFFGIVILVIGYWVTAFAEFQPVAGKGWWEQRGPGVAFLFVALGLLFLANWLLNLGWRGWLISVGLIVGIETVVFYLV